MPDWYFNQAKQKLVLGTSPAIRADLFYRLQGWKPVGSYTHGDTQFEMRYEDWNRNWILCALQVLVLIPGFPAPGQSHKTA
jgi:hypothetical protein